MLDDPVPIPRGEIFSNLRKKKRLLLCITVVEATQDFIALKWDKKTSFQELKALQKTRVQNKIKDEAQQVVWKENIWTKGPMDHLSQLVEKLKAQSIIARDLWWHKSWEVWK